MDPNKEELEDQQDQMTDESEAEAPPQSDDLDGDDALSVMDADELELQEAEAAAKAEEDGEAGEEEADESDDDPSQYLPPREPEANSPAEDIRIPKARFDQVAHEARASKERAAELERELAYLKGRLEGTTGKPVDGKEPEPEPKEDPAEVRKRELREVRTQYDNGEISYADMAEKEEEIEAKYRQAPEQPNIPDPDQLAEHVNQRNYVAQKTAEIVNDNPWLRQRTQGLNEALAKDLAALRPQAIERAKAAGYSVDDSPMGGLVLRAFLVEAAEEAGLHEIYAATAATRTGSAPAPSSTPQKPGTSKQTQPGKPSAKQRADKVALANGHPPDLSAAGTPAAPGALPTPEEIAQMSDEDIESLPESVQERILAGM